MKKKNRIYILPTKMGGYFNSLIFLMFLLSIGYSNNLFLIFTLILFCINLLWVIQTHFHLHQLSFEALYIEDGHVGETIPFSVIWKSSPPGLMNWQLRLECDKGNVPLRELNQQQNETQGDLNWNQRGAWEWSYLFIATERPFGLYRAWRHIKVQGRSYAYPALIKTYLAPLVGLGPEGEVSAGLKGTGEIRDLVPYSGEEARKINWKHYARTGKLLIKEGEDLKAPMAELKWVASQHPQKEESLSTLAGQMVLCHRESIPFTFELAGNKRGPSDSVRHLKLCLQDLSQC